MEFFGVELSAASVAVIVAGGWCAISLLVSLGGWASLARHYRFDGRFEGRKFRFQSAGFRRGPGYNAGVVVGVDASGLFLSVMPLLRLGHAPLLIPWSEIESTERRAFWVRRVDLRFRRAPRTELRITPKLAARLRDAVPEHWPPARSEGAD